jgi:hypothetical protein
MLLARRNTPVQGASKTPLAQQPLLLQKPTLPGGQEATTKEMRSARGTTAALAKKPFFPGDQAKTVAAQTSLEQRVAAAGGGHTRGDRGGADLTTAAAAPPHQAGGGIPKPAVLKTKPEWKAAPK